MDCSRSCMFCKMDGPVLSDRLMLIHRLKLMFATDKVNKNYFIFHNNLSV